MAVLSIIPPALEVETREIMVRGQSGQKVGKTTISTNKSDVVVHTCHPSYAGGVNRRIVVHTGLSKKAQNLH
jgi:heterodisulfide reductase subunit A-like polyferredoxin